MQTDTNLKNMYILSDLSYTDMKDYLFFEEVLLTNIDRQNYKNLTKIEKIQEYLKYKNSPNRTTIENKTKEDKDIIAIQYGIKSMKQSFIFYFQNNITQNLLGLKKNHI